MLETILEVVTEISTSSPHTSERVMKKHFVGKLQR